MRRAGDWGVIISIKTKLMGSYMTVYKCFSLGYILCQNAWNIIILLSIENAYMLKWYVFVYILFCIIKLHRKCKTGWIYIKGK